MSTVASNVFLGTGRRKTSTARVRISEGTGKLTCNDRDFEDYFSHENFAKRDASQIRSGKATRA